MKERMTAAILFACGIIGGIIGTKRIYKEKLEEERKLSNKHLEMFLMMNQWVKIIQKGKKIENYFKIRGYRRIAVYGLGYVGETLIEALKGTEIEVSYGIDKKIHKDILNINVLSVEDSLKEIDAVVVTAITFYEDIKFELCSKIDCPILSLEDILYEI